MSLRRQSMQLKSFHVYRYARYKKQHYIYRNDSDSLLPVRLIEYVKYLLFQEIHTNCCYEMHTRSM